MVLITGIVVPFIFGVIYFCLDIMVCMVDNTCGKSLFNLLFYTDFTSLFGGIPAEMQDWSQYMTNITSVFTPFLYIDDIFYTLMLFLLGALIFKTSKTGKTLGCLILLALSLEMVLSPIIAITFIDKFRILSEGGFDDMTYEMFTQTFPLISWMGRHIILVDTISDGLMNCLVLFLIWLRFSRMKH